MFLAGDGASLITDAAINSVEGKGTGKLVDHFGELIKGGAHIYISGNSTKARNITDADRAGEPAELAMPAKLVELAAAADVVLVYPLARTRSRHRRNVAYAVGSIVTRRMCSPSIAARSCAPSWRCNSLVRRRTEGGPMSRDEKSRRSIAFWTPVSGAAKGSKELYPAAYAMERGDAIAAFFDRYRPGSDLRELVDGFRQLARDVGFSASAAGAWIGTGVNRTSRFFFNDWPTDWLKRYADGNFGKRDPIVLEAHRRIEPFQWTEMLDQPTFKADGAEVWAAGQDYGWVDGFSVPIHGPGGYQALVSLASLQPITLPAGDRRLLQAVALFVHDECRHGIDPGLPPLPALSPRQLECLRWVAAGKTDAEIGRLLGITTPTVHFHIEGAKRLLGLRSRSQAVAVLVLHGLV